MKMKVYIYKSLFFVLLLSLSSLAFAQDVQLTGVVKDDIESKAVPFANISLFDQKDSSFVQGTYTNESGRFLFEGLAEGNYYIEVSYLGFATETLRVRAGRLNQFLDVGTIILKEQSEALAEILVTARREEVSGDLDRKTFGIDENISQLGGSVLQAMQNLPGVTIDREGKVNLRGSENVAVLIDGKQTALTGFGQQEGLDNIPASAVERIEIINNPSAKYDATGMAGIINIVFKKEKQEGFNGKVGFNGGVGALGIKQENLPGIRDQYQFTPKINPSASINYKKDNVNWFLNGDVLWHQRMMRNEFIERRFDDGQIIEQQFLENRTQPIYNVKTGLDWNVNEKHTLTFFGLFNYRAYNDLGDLPYFDKSTGNRVRLWQYDELEVNQTLTTSLAHIYQFDQPGHTLESNVNYSFRRKDEVFFFDNFLENSFGTDTTSLIADEHIVDVNVDYTRPLRSGRLELGTKQRSRIFPNNITFTPGENSILDLTLAGTAEYREWLSAFYGNYVYEAEKLEVEAGLRVEYAQIDYLVDPRHSVYSDDGFTYFEPFPNLRATWLINDNSRLSLFYNRRVDRPEEKNLRVFPTYADPEILRIGNPSLIPQFTQTIEAGYKLSWQEGYIYGAAYHRMLSNILTTIITSFPDDRRLVSVDQNAGTGTNTGFELIFNQRLSKYFRMDFNINVYQNVIDAFSVVNLYPVETVLERDRRDIITGNAKLNLAFNLGKWGDLQWTVIYLAPDLVPQGTIDERFSIDMGYKKSIQNGRGELFANFSDVFNTLVIRYDLRGNDFDFVSTDFFETQVLRVGYNYRF